MNFVIIFFGWIFSLCLHEFSHALVAYYGGDTTVKDKGYLTFNPLKYTHPFLSLILPLIILLMGGIGLPGGAVYQSLLVERHVAGGTRCQWSLCHRPRHRITAITSLHFNPLARNLFFAGSTNLGNPFQSHSAAWAGWLRRYRTIFASRHP